MQYGSSLPKSIDSILSVCTATLSVTKVFKFSVSCKGDLKENEVRDNGGNGKMNMW